jgi:predicted ATP-grasp superfamily ATP-dependent carboligase
MTDLPRAARAMPNVLILDANQRSALACTRSLGRKGLVVFTADETSKTLAGASRYSSKGLVYPSPHTDPRGFAEAVSDLTVEHGIQFLLPVTEVSAGSIIMHSDAFPRSVVIPFASAAAVELLSNKYSLFKLAEKVGIPTPRTFFIDSPDRVEDVKSELTFPLVIKPFRSRIHTNNSWIQTAVTYAKSYSDLTRRIEQTGYLSSHPFLLQELVRGTGSGLFTLYRHGRQVACFGHRRIRQKPPSGGVSVLSESCHVSEAMQEVAGQLLGHAAWEGVAMVEFIVAEDGTPFLMEVNTRFWGSLQLSIDAGVDFPHLLYRVFTGDEVPLDDGYRDGVRLRWLLGDLDRLYLVLRNKDQNYQTAGKMRELVDFLRPDFRRTKHEINRLDDLGPAWFEAKRYLADLL